MPAKTIDDVLSALENIIAESIRSGDRVGYFAALYFKVTSRVKEGIAQGSFQQGGRMGELDVIFANRYLTALEQWKAKGNPTLSWKVAFETAQRRSALILQHLLLGINAHINLDLGIAAVEVVGGTDITPIRSDFDAINDIIASLTLEIIGDINRMSPVVSLMGLHSGRQESLLVQFSVSNARDGAWCFAELLASKTGDAYDQCIAARDADISKMARTIALPRGFMKLTVWFIHLFEWKRAANIIEVLHHAKKAFIKAADLK